MRIIVPQAIVLARNDTIGGKDLASIRRSFKMETTGIEPVHSVLQTDALPSELSLHMAHEWHLQGRRAIGSSTLLLSPVCRYGAATVAIGRHYVHFVSQFKTHGQLPDRRATRIPFTRLAGHCITSALTFRADRGRYVRP